MFWLFEPVEESGGQMVVRKRGTNMCRLTRVAPSVPSKTPLFAYARSSLRHSPAKLLREVFPDVINDSGHICTRPDEICFLKALKKVFNTTKKVNKFIIFVRVDIWIRRGRKVDL